ncbi:discoidin domain-containing protein [Aquibacillus koreensis]|uniref:Discoidin domain-containing protein n=1 Tax=Aquibacillus koreensis TaxID=279446 RepID=A0A9X3WME7_9BACI|nr:discoidin domain-containing protein [Aquibacillus koreensis]MCT2537076.1 discoidin domain-containing protein [Aquibacillus koreensis]MDC3419941.1 discoidin domain-containing protein [Aquibacillus koreensis]
MQKTLYGAGSIIALLLILIVLSPVVSHAASTDDANNSIFGENVYVFTDDMDDGDIQEILDSEFALLENGDTGAEFTDHRATFYFMPGEYDVDIDVGFYMHIAGLGQNPNDVVINGSFDVDAQWTEGNGTRNFWRSVENFSVKETEAQSKWAVSQAAPMRRMHFDKTLWLWDLTPSWNAGWVSGGFIADSVMDSTVLPASQQQFFSRNNSYEKWDGSLWNTVLLGDESNQTPTGLAPYPESTYTIIEEVPAIREKPYLYHDGSDYQLFVPSLQENRKGVTWDNGEETPGTAMSLDDFYIADPSDSDEELNAALESGKHLLFTPGVYYVDAPIEVNDPNTIVYGFGLPTIVPENGVTAMKVADEDGIQIAGLLFDAGEQESEQLLEVGPEGNSNADHADNPISLHDLFFRVGGSRAGKAETSVEINASDVIVDHFWVWRADHGEGVGWDVNKGDYGLITNGDDVTIYGLFVEHYQKYQTLWNGEDGRVFFYQNEIPYDVPNQETWMSHDGTQNGYAAYKVADHVNNHTLWGAGSYSYFRDADVNLYNSFEVPYNDGISMNHMTTVWLNGMAGSEIENVINGIGDNVTSSSDMVANVTSFQGGDNEAPTTPNNLTATALSSNEIALAWDASTDNVGVAEYEIYRDGTYVATSIKNSYNDTGLTAETSFSYSVKAKDAAGNVSDASNEASASTSAEEIVLDRADWTATGNVNGTTTDANAILDGNIGSQWQSGTAMRPGMFVTVDMKEEKTFERIVLDANGSGDYARGYKVYVSNDGTSWGDPVAEGAGTTSKIFIDFAEQKARYIKVEQTGTVDPSWWSVNELLVIDYAGAGEEPGDDPVDVTALEDLITTAKTYSNNDGTYTDASFQALQDAITTAEAALDTVETAEDVTTAVIVLQTAIDGLVEAPVTDGPVDRSEWEITSNIPEAQGDTAILLDGSLDGRWSSGKPMEPGQYLIIDLKSQRIFNQLVLQQQQGDHARAYEIYVSTDGTNWGNPVASGTDVEEGHVTIDFTEQTARYVKIVQNSTNTSWWSINELDITHDGNDPLVPEPVLDVTPLEDLIETAKGYSNDDDTYTEGSFQTLQDAIATAQAALDTVESHDDVTAAVAALQTAIDGLVLAPEPVDVTALEDLIATAQGYSNDDDTYTEGSFQAFQDAIATAQASLGTVESDDDVTAAVDALQAAIDGLVLAPEPVDVTALEDLIATAQGYSNDDDIYTEGSFQAFQDAITAAQAALGTVESDDDVTAAVDALQAAIDGLVVATEPVDVTALEDLIETAQGYSNDDDTYTEGSFQTLQDAIAAAQAALGTVESDDDVTAAVDALQAAIDGLEEVTEPEPVDVTELEKLIETAEGYSNDDEAYTDASFQALQDAITAAKTALGTVESDEDVKVAVDALQAAIDGLVSTPKDPGTEDPSTEDPGTKDPDQGEDQDKDDDKDKDDEKSGDDKDKEDDQDKDEELPDTATSMFNFILVGLVLLLGGGLFYILYRRKSTN